MGNYDEIYVHSDINVYMYIYIYIIFYNRTQKATQYTEDILSFKPCFLVKIFHAFNFQFSVDGI